jgi:hypothetical protein
MRGVRQVCNTATMAVLSITHHGEGACLNSPWVGAFGQDLRLWRPDPVPPAPDEKGRGVGWCQLEREGLRCHCDAPEQMFVMTPIDEGV